MGACESCGGRDRTEVTTEPKPKPKPNSTGDDERSGTATTSTSTSHHTRTASVSTTSRGAPGYHHSGGGGGGDRPPKLLRPQSSDAEAVKVDGASPRSASLSSGPFGSTASNNNSNSNSNSKRPAPAATKTKLTPLGEGNEPPSPLDRALSPRGTTTFAGADRYRVPGTPDDNTGDGLNSRMLKPKDHSGSSAGGSSAAKRDEMKRADTAASSGRTATSSSSLSSSASSPFGGAPKKKERELTGSIGGVSSGTGSSGGPASGSLRSPTASNAHPMSGSLKRVQTPATGAVATPASPLSARASPLGATKPIAERDDDEEPPSPRAPSLAAALAEASSSPAPSPAAPAPGSASSLAAALAAAGVGPSPSPSSSPSPLPSPSPAPPQTRALSDAPKPKPLDTSVGALLPGSAPPTPSRAGTPIGTPKAEPPAYHTLPAPPATPTSAVASTEDAAANKAEAARQRQQTLKDERLARERADAEASAQRAAQEAASASVRAARADAAKKERDAKYAAIAEEKRQHAAREAAQKQADDETKARIADNPAAVSMADKAALIAGALTPKEGDSANVDALVRQHLRPARDAVLNFNNSKVFARVLPDKLPAAYATLVDALCDPHNAHVTSLSMTYCGLTDEFLVALSAALPRLPPGLTELVLESNDFGGNGLKALAEALPANHVLRTIKVDNQKKGVFPPDARSALLKALEANDTVTSFGMAQSGSVDERNTLDKHLQKNRARLRAASTPKAAKVAVDNPFTQRMEAVRSGTDTAVVFELQDATHRQQFMAWPADQQQKWVCDVAHRNTHVADLKLSGLQLRETVVTALCSALAGNTRVTKLDLAGNAMTEPCVRALVDCLRANTALTDVRLTECKISVKSEALFMALAESRANTTLRVLKMSWSDKNAEKKVDSWLQANKKAARDASKYATL